MDGSILTDDFLRQLINVGEVDILVGVPTYNNAETVGQVVQAIRAGLLNYFPRERAVIINADGGSRDGTSDLVRGASINDLQHVSNLRALRTLHCISTEYPGGPAPDTALRTIVSAAELLRAGACAVISPQSTSIEPEWIEHLLRPVTREKFDLVTPLYRRHKFDGLLVRNLVYPMTRALYARQIREPYSSEFAFSGRLGSSFLAQDLWQHEAARAGTEISLTITAMSGGFSIAQSFLGTKSHEDRKSSDLVPAIRQTVGALFWWLDTKPGTWTSNNGSQAVPMLGADSQVLLEPLRVNRKRLHGMFQSGVAELEPVLRSILSAATLQELQRISSAPEDRCSYPDDIWVRTVYEFASAYHKSVINRDHVIQALAPLYRGKTYSFLMENRETSAEQVQSSLESLCQTFEGMKPYLLEMWDGRK